MSYRPSRKRIYPANRNYNIVYGQNIHYERCGANGAVLQVKNYNGTHRSAQLTVNNPWRKQKPAALDPTARTLTYLRQQAPITKYRVGAYGSPYVTYDGPNSVPVSREYTRRFFSPTWGANNEQLRTEAILQALAKVKDQKWNAGVALAESEGVVTMVEDVLTVLTRVRHTLRKGDFRQAYRDFRKMNARSKNPYKSYPKWRRDHWAEIRHVKSVRKAKLIPEGWLYYHFAIVPTLNDISDAANAHATKLADLLYGETPFVQGYAKETTKVAQVYTEAEYNCHIKHDVLVSLRVKIRVRPKSYLGAKLSELGVTNVPEALWNRAPWSWAVDYFTNFGSYLSALDSSVGWEWADKWEECWRVVATSVITPVTTDIYMYTYPKEPGFIRYKNITRNIRGDLYGPMGSILPTFKRKGPSLQKISNLLSAFSMSMKLKIHP